MAQYANEETPRDIPVKKPGPSYAVLARLVAMTGDESWMPARAVRWSHTHVMVRLQETELDDPTYVWLRSADVRRSVRITGSIGGHPAGQ